MRARGICLDDFATNGILLPAFESEARSANLPVHVLGHRRYNAMVIDRLQAIRTSCESIRLAQTREDNAAELVRQMQRNLKETIRCAGFGSLDTVALDGTDGFYLDAVIAAQTYGCKNIAKKVRP